jgi:hypothetical protein
VGTEEQGLVGPKSGHLTKGLSSLACFCEVHV